MDVLCKLLNAWKIEYIYIFNLAYFKTKGVTNTPTCLAEQVTTYNIRTPRFVYVVKHFVFQKKKKYLGEC